MDKEIEEEGEGEEEQKQQEQQQQQELEQKKQKQEKLEPEDDEEEEEEEVKAPRTIPYPPGVHPIYETYPCKKKEEEESDIYSRPCQIISIPIPEVQNQPQEKEKKEKKEKEKKEPPKPPSKKKFEEFKETKTCTLPYSRTWAQEEAEQRNADGLPKWFSQPREPVARPAVCPRELDDYEKKLWVPICQKKEEEYEECKEPIDWNLCVFCLGSLYLNGYIHDLFEKVPKIKKQSEKYGDDIAERIGIRTRITVHKKCYDDYVDILKHKKDEEEGEEEDEDEDMTCDVKEKESEEDEDKEEEKDKDKDKNKKKKKRLKAQDLSKLPKKPCFCLKKFQIPTIKPARFHERSRAGSVRIQAETLQTGTMGRFKPHGLVADLWPNIRLLQLSGHFLHEYHDDNSARNVLMRKMYSWIHLVLVFLHFAAIIANLAMEADDVNILAANSITVLFFTHCITKFCYFALRRGKFYRTLSIWDTQNSHPLFAESHSRHRAIAITKSRRLLMITVIGTLLTVVGWTGSTFFGDSTKTISDPENNNETITVEIPRLMMRAWYPWDASSGSNYMLSFIYQLYWLVFTLFHANLVDLLFCSWLIFACEQLLHVKEIMKPLIDLSSSLDTYNPGSADLFKAASAIDSNVENFYDSKDDGPINIRSIYSNMRDFGINRNSVSGTISTVNGIGPNGLSKKHEMLVRSAIKYWVERHKHIVRYVGAIGDAYGLALLLHMLTSTITLTLLAYQATKIDGMDLYAMAVLGYLFYSLAQVFAFCIYGNQLIEESSSVMEAAYSCQWYDGSEEAKTFVQIVCQQCQKALSISGAKFFTVSLDLFASVLGAVVTYFMVLVQLK